MAPLRPSGSRAAAPTAVVKGRAALTRSTKEGRLQTRPPATCASRNQTRTIRSLETQNIHEAPHSSPNPAFKTRSRELDTLPVQMWCSASSGVVMAPLRALPPAAHGTASSSRRIQRPVRLHASRLPTPVTHPHRLGSWTRRPLSYRPPASLARFLSRPLLTSSVAATRARKQS